WHAMTPHWTDQKAVQGRLLDLYNRARNEKDDKTAKIYFGQYLHYLGDTVSHAGYAPIVGHAKDSLMTPLGHKVGSEFFQDPDITGPAKSDKTLLTAKSFVGATAAFQRDRLSEKPKPVKAEEIQAVVKGMKYAAPSDTETIGKRAETAHLRMEQELRNAGAPLKIPKWGSPGVEPIAFDGDGKVKNGPVVPSRWSLEHKMEPAVSELSKLVPNGETKRGTIIYDRYEGKVVRAVIGSEAEVKAQLKEQGRFGTKEVMVKGSQNPNYEVSGTNTTATGIISPAPPAPQILNLGDRIKEYEKTNPLRARPEDYERVLKVVEKDSARKTIDYNKPQKPSYGVNGSNKTAAGSLSPAPQPRLTEQEKLKRKVDPQKVQSGPAMQQLKGIAGQGPGGRGTYEGERFDGGPGSTLNEPEKVKQSVPPPVPSPKVVDTTGKTPREAQQVQQPSRPQTREEQQRESLKRQQERIQEIKAQQQQDPQIKAQQLKELQARERQEREESLKRQ
ncbi:MAG: hypothetical protein Q8M54_06415, partial [Desulfobaccales bacterium]|nr:hypothetical protein [Desulfobaccales bacterium]